jgi:site-specific DNA-methyltransferase (adenine-specific)
MITETTSPPSGLASPSCSASLPVPFYEDDLVTLYHGDCREILPKLRGDAIITDPPFKLSQSYAANVDADNLDAVASLIDSARMMAAVMPVGGLAAIFYDNRIMPFALNAFARAEWSYLRFMPFYRRWGNAHKLSGWMSTSDPILLFGMPGKTAEFFGDWKHDCYIKDKPEAEDAGHPAQKPIWILEHLASHICPPGGTVIDPYAGSGSTLIGAKKAGRRAVGIEKELWACEIAAKRLAVTERVERMTDGELTFSPLNKEIAGA